MIKINKWLISINPKKCNQYIFQLIKHIDTIRFIIQNNNSLNIFENNFDI